MLSYLDLLIDTFNGDLVSSIFDRRDTFDFDIVNFPDLSGNIPTARAYWYIYPTADKIQSGLP